MDLGNWEILQSAVSWSALATGVVGAGLGIFGKTVKAVKTEVDYFVERIREARRGKVETITLSVDHFQSVTEGPDDELERALPAWRRWWRVFSTLTQRGRWSLALA